jgi:hypothetical protein
MPWSTLAMIPGRIWRSSAPIWACSGPAPARPPTAGPARPLRPGPADPAEGSSELGPTPRDHRRAACGLAAGDPGPRAGRRGTQGGESRGGSLAIARSVTERVLGAAGGMVPIGFDVPERPGRATGATAEISRGVDSAPGGSADRVGVAPHPGPAGPAGGRTDGAQRGFRGWPAPARAGRAASLVGLRRRRVNRWRSLKPIRRDANGSWTR